ncbi:MAG: efflux RND transporter periplasmic adaptor subunit [Syntrophales bacterium]|nr:efflux RND transporter periplasmic adaptor subunit [Syntrophales bacterium]
MQNLAVKRGISVKLPEMTLLRILTCLLIGIMFIGIGCSKKEEKAAPEKVVNIRTATVEKKTLRPYVEAVGTLKAYEEVLVSTEIDGILKRLHVVEGSRVAKGSLIAEIKETDYVLAVRQAEAALRQSRANLKNTRQEYERKDALFKEQLVTRQQFDDVVARLEVAECDMDRSISTLDLAKEKLTKTRIFAPIAGGVKEKRAAAGDFIKNGGPIASIIQTDPLKLNFTVVEKDVGKLRAGQDVTFQVDSFPNQTFQGKLKNIFANMDERTRSLQVEALVPNSNDTLKSGLFARVILYTGVPRETVAIPITAILYEASDLKVFIVENGRAVERPIRVGQKFGQSMEITEGLKGGEMLVVTGQNNLAKGVKVDVAR